MALMATIPRSYKPVKHADVFMLKIDFSSNLRRLECFSPIEAKNLCSPRIRQNAGARLRNTICRSAGTEKVQWKKSNDTSPNRELGPIRTLILDNYDSYTYNLFQLLSVINGVAPLVLKNDEITFEELQVLLYEERAFDNIVISPGPGSPMQAEDIGISMQVLQECPDIPILGVCLGHQALGFSHGAKVVHAPEPVHGRLSELEHNGHPLFDKIPSGTGSGFKVVRYHSLVIDAASVPDDLIPTAWTILSDGPVASCPNGSSAGLVNGTSNGNAAKLLHLSGEAGMGPTPKTGYTSAKNQEVVLMAISHRTRPHHGVQFHPESVATAHGKQMLENFCSITQQYWQQQNTQGLWTPCLSISPQVSTVTVEDDRKDGCVERQVDNDLHSGQLRVHWEKLNGFAGTAGGSENIFCDLFGVEAAEDTYWLDSSTRDQGGARFSYMGGRGGSLWRRLTYSLGDAGVSGVVKIEDAPGNIREQLLEDGFFNYLNEECRITKVGYVLAQEAEQSIGGAPQNFQCSIFLCGKWAWQELTSRSCLEADYADLPFDFCGGFVGYLGYELKVECGVRSNRHKSTLPDAALFLADRAVVIDHSNDDVYVLALFQEPTSFQRKTTDAMNGTVTEGAEESNGSPVLRGEYVHGVAAEGQSLKQNRSLNGQNYYKKAGLEKINVKCEKSTAEAWVSTTVGRITILAERGVDLASKRRHFSQFSSPVETGNEMFTPPFTLEKSRTSYISDINECKRLIRDGETYEVCLTAQLRRETQYCDTLGLYLTLRKTNPAPYASWLHFGKDGPQVCCSSPERFLRLDRGGTLEAKPIKGTLPRGRSPIEDERLRYELQHSEKDYAENLMIVDLLRNDLGRVSVPGSVHVPSLMAVESYTTVHTLVSTVRGEKRDDISPIDCIKAAFPGGSMTGAPKLRTMEILDTIESGPRGIYSGTIGFLSFNSAFDLNIVIRTLVFSQGEVRIGAGGAVTTLSDPDAEYEEMLLKTRAPIRAMAKFEGGYRASTNPGHRGAASAVST